VLRRAPPEPYRATISPEGPVVTRRHWQLAGVLTFALVIDVMKPFTIGFVLPGLTAEYGLSTFQSALLPIFALTGTVIGSYLFGVIADSYGRRPAIMLSALLFVSTSVCGAMPSFYLNLLMCFVMGSSAGGFLPIAFALLSEVGPAQHRGWLAVLIGNVGSTGGYLAASLTALLVEPSFGWRALWLMGFPTGLCLILLARHIPESPSHLLVRADIPRTNKTPARLRTTLGLGDTDQRPTVGDDPQRRRRALQVTVPLLCYGLAWGVANFGFLTWLPTTLHRPEYNGLSANVLLASAAVIALIAAPLPAWSYSRWSARGSIVLAALAVAAGLSGIALLEGVAFGALTLALLALIFFGLASASAMLLPFSADSYRSAVRARGVGLVAASTKIGGLIGPAFVGLLLSVFGGLAPAAVATALPIGLAAVLVMRASRDVGAPRE
jgi:putative MFS transporter